MLRLLPLLLFVVSIWSCSSEPTDKKQEPLKDSVVTKENFEAGKVIDTIICKNNPSYSFSLYLPSNYSGKKTYPVVYILDPHADGKLPINKYKDVAEKHNYILVGSNNSENGKTWEESNQIVNSLLTDINSRISINTARQYLMGFSGGARIANAYTISNGAIEAVVCCGAVSPASGNNNPRNNYTLVAITGTADFNYVEICKYQKLEGYKIKNTIIKFDGKHEWPTAETIADAFLFLELNEMRKNNLYKNDSLVNQLVEKETKHMNELLKKNKIYEASEVCKKTIVYYNGLHNLKEFYSAYEKFKTDKEIDKVLRIEEAFWKLEEQEKAKYIQALQNNDFNWWKKNIADVNKKIKSGNIKQEEINMNKRLLEFLSLTTYMQTNSAIKANNIPIAEHFCNIYLLVDPTNNEAHYLKAEINAINGKTKEAIRSLSDAIKNDFIDVKRLENDNSFSSIKNDEEFKKIVEKLK